MAPAAPELNKRVVMTAALLNDDGYTSNVLIASVAFTVAHLMIGVLLERMYKGELKGWPLYT